MTDQNTRLRHPIFYKSLPKVELHRHLEGSLRLSTMMEIARKFELDLPVNHADTFRHLVQVHDDEPFTFQNFLSKFDTLRHFYQSPEVIQRVTREAIADAAADNIRYMELRFTPVALTRVKGFPMNDAIDWVIEAAQDAAASYGIAVSLIVSVNRHESVELAEEAIRLGIERREQGVIAVDLAGGEADFPGEEFAPLFTEAHQAGMRVTIHAGEWGPASRIQLAIEQLHAERVGHGVRVLEDPDVVALCKERGIVFEVCPTSNYQSGVTRHLRDHPLPNMRDAGLKVTINTDDPGISQIDLSDEYEVAVETLRFNVSQLHATILEAAHATFLAEPEKQALVSAIDHEFAEKSKR
jgi:adenosine deaminase